MIPFLDYAPAIQMIEVNDLNIRNFLLYMDNFIKTDDKLINIHGLGRVGRLGSAQDCGHILPR